MKLLSILIPFTPDREESMVKLRKELQHQFDQYAPYEDACTIIEYCDNYENTIGKKRNSLLATATSKYVAFVDSDDMVTGFYIPQLLEGIEANADCCSLKGIMTTDGKNPEIFEHSQKYNAWETVEGATGDQVKYLRYQNHLNCIRTSIARQFKFPETNFGEDHIWSRQLHESGLIKTEYYIEPIIYLYQYKNNK